MRILLLSLLLAPQAGPERPNIVFILADDLGWRDLETHEAPNLARLAKGGLRFTHMSNSARCCPTRAALLSGLHPAQAGIPNAYSSTPLAAARAASTSGSSVPSETTEWQCRSALRVAVKVPDSSRPSRLTVEKPVSVKVTA